MRTCDHVYVTAENGAVRHLLYFGSILWTRMPYPEQLDYYAEVLGAPVVEIQVGVNKETTWKSSDQ